MTATDAAGKGTFPRRAQWFTDEKCQTLGGWKSLLTSGRRQAGGASPGAWPQQGSGVRVAPETAGRAQGALKPPHSGQPLGQAGAIGLAGTRSACSSFSSASDEEEAAQQGQLAQPDSPQQPHQAGTVRLTFPTGAAGRGATPPMMVTTPPGPVVISIPA